MARTIRQPALRREARWDDADRASVTDAALADWDAIGDPVLGPAAGLRLVAQLEDAERIRDDAERRVLALFTEPCPHELTAIANNF